MKRSRFNDYCPITDISPCFPLSLAAESFFAPEEALSHAKGIVTTQVHTKISGKFGCQVQIHLLSDMLIFKTQGSSAAI